MLIAQLSDPHIRPDGVRYQGVADSNRSLTDAIAHILAFDRRPDLVLITGDLVDEGQPAEYQALRTILIIGLDSTVPGLHHGHLDAGGLQWLADTLARDTAKPTLLMLHHPPFVSGIPYMDEYRYFDGAELASVVKQFDNIEIVLCGHVHRSMLTRWANTVVCACPSTATEIDLQLADSAQPASHIGPRACMLHLWDPRHGLVSHTSQIGDFDGPYPFA